MPPERVALAGMIARWKPVHLGHKAVLLGLVENADHALVGIGSSNRYDAQNPFTAEETAEMIRRALAGYSNYEILEVPDLGHGPRWRAMVAEMFGPLDRFVTANAYVRNLMTELYTVVHPVRLVPPERRVRVDGTMVRVRMAEGGDWESLVPVETAAFLRERDLVERFRREFGYETLASESPS